MAAFGMGLLLARHDLEEQRMWMKLAHGLLSRFTRNSTVCLRRPPEVDCQTDLSALSQEKLRTVHLTPERAPAFALLEIAFLVTLTSADRIVSATAAQCLRMIAGAERQKGATPSNLISEEEKAKRYPVYEQLGDSKSFIGR